jgi:hypothetical protein
LRTAYVKGAVLILAALVLAVEGYLVFRYYDRHYGGNAVSSETVVPAPAVAEDAASRTTTEQGTRTAFVHRSAPDNIVRNSTYIDHPATNENPEAILLVTQSRKSEDGVTNAHPIGVWYDAYRGGRWAVFNQDLAPIPEDVEFNVVVEEADKGGGSGAVIHRAGPANTVDNATYLEHPATNGNPEAVLSVTQNWNPGGGSGLYNVHPVGTRYDASEERWAIVNQDLAPIPRDAAFNVIVSGATSG